MTTVRTNAARQGGKKSKRGLTPEQRALLWQKRVLTTGQASKLSEVSQQTIIRQFDRKQDPRLRGYVIPGSDFRRIPIENFVQWLHENGMENCIPLDWTPPERFSMGPRQLESDVDVKSIWHKEILTTGDVAKIAGTAPRTVSKWFDQKLISGSYRVPGSKDRRFLVNGVVSFLHQHGMDMLLPIEYRGMYVAAVLGSKSSDNTIVIDAVREELGKRNVPIVDITSPIQLGKIIAQRGAIAPRVVLIDAESGVDAADYERWIVAEPLFAATKIVVIGVRGDCSVVTKGAKGKIPGRAQALLEQVCNSIGPS